MRDETGDLDRVDGGVLDGDRLFRRWWIWSGRRRSHLADPGAGGHRALRGRGGAGGLEEDEEVNDMATRYKAIQDRLAKLGERRAVLEAQETARGEERTKLVAELAEAGVDVTDLEGEATRLREAADEALTKAEWLVEEFDKQLGVAAAAMGGSGQGTPAINIE
jgi:hypothetical protein